MPAAAAATTATAAAASRPVQVLVVIIFQATVTCVGLLLVMFRYLMGQLAIQSIDMKHMDPTDIVLVPFDLHRLTIYVAGVLLGSVGLLVYSCSFTSGRRPHDDVSFLASFLVLGRYWFQTTLAFWVVAIVCGTPPTIHVYHTVVACAYMATLVVVLTTSTCPPLLLPFQQQQQQHTIASSLSFVDWWQARLALPILKIKNDNNNNNNNNGSSESRFYTHWMATCQIHATVFVTIPFQVLRLYDWGSQIQRWPLPILLGSTYGFVVGTLWGTISIMALYGSPRLQRWYSTSWTAAHKTNNNLQAGRVGTTLDTSNQHQD